MNKLRFIETDRLCEIVFCILNAKSSKNIRNSLRLECKANEHLDCTEIHCATRSLTFQCDRL